MPRGKSSSTGPSAASRFTQPRGGRQNGKMITLDDVCNAEAMWSLLQDAVVSGAAVTVSATRDGSSICVSFFADGERSPWYLTGVEDWSDMVATTAV